MLKQPSEYPHPGSEAFVSPHGERVRIIQRNADGTALIAHQRPVALRSASDTRTVPQGDLHATPEAALGRKPIRKRRAA